MNRPATGHGAEDSAEGGEGTKTRTMSTKDKLTFFSEVFGLVGTLADFDFFCP